MRLIDVGDLMYEAETSGWDIDTSELRMILKYVPLVDAVQVVRCGECRYRELAKVNRKGFTICPASGMEITDDDFCSYGAKMDGGDGDAKSV